MLRALPALVRARQCTQCWRTLNSTSRNIVTVEDPVEYRIPGINQVASDNDHGLGFANALKYIMRQDPDVIMVGEIRDHETAATSVQAALTGHLLISTLAHQRCRGSSSAPQVILGIDSFKTGGALLGSIAQRLLRASLPPLQGIGGAQSEHFLQALPHRTEPRSMHDTIFYCRSEAVRSALAPGYLGRIPIYEIMTVTPALAHAIEKGSADDQTA